MRWPHLPILLALLLPAACDDGHAAPDDDVLVDATDDVQEVVEDAQPIADVWPADYWAPSSIEQLYGYWVSDDGETIRAFQFGQFDLFDKDMAQVSPVYELFRYPVGGSPILIERGRVTLQLGPSLKREIIWSQTVTDKGKTSADPMLASPKDTFALATGTGTPRVYTRATELP